MYRFTTRVLSVLAVLATAGCGLIGGVPRGWTEHEDPKGFSVNVPEYWEVSVGSLTGRVNVTSSQGDELVIWPVFLPRGGSPDAALNWLTRRLWPAAIWSPPVRTGSAGIVQRGRAGASEIAASFRAVESPKGSSACLYAIKGKGAITDELVDQASQVFSSFRVTGAPVSKSDEPAAPAQQYQRWNEPKESAFSLEVPVGWQVSGGLFRFASVDTRPVVDAVSPDGSIHLRIGDANVPPFTLPSQTLDWTGFREGSWYSPGYGVRMMVRRYLTGEQFAAEYAQGTVSQTCPGLQITGTKNRQDAVQQINQIGAQYGIQAQSTGGEVNFTCTLNGRPAKGYYFAVTQMTAMSGSGVWNVNQLVGGTAVTDQFDQAGAILAHMVETSEINPQWAQMQQGITANTSTIVSQTNAVITNIITSTYEHTQAVQDEISRRRSNATLGLEDVVDTQTGQEFKIESGSNYYWIDPQGNIVGTNTYSTPDPSVDFREMFRRP